MHIQNEASAAELTVLSFLEMFENMPHLFSSITVFFLFKTDRIGALYLWQGLSCCVHYSRGCVFGERAARYKQGTSKSLETVSLELLS